MNFKDCTVIIWAGKFEKLDLDTKATVLAKTHSPNVSTTKDFRATQVGLPKNLEGLYTAFLEKNL